MSKGNIHTSLHRSFFLTQYLYNKGIDHVLYSCFPVIRSKNHVITLKNALKNQLHPSTAPKHWILHEHLSQQVFAV